LDDSDIGAVACRAFEQSGQATEMLGQGELDRMILASSEGNVIITRAGRDALCVVLLHPDAKLGVASVEAVRISQQIVELLG
jgi:predicted regulator of Ras-like GTPase activity (Roadblock/LC7/MglB family)